MFEIIQQLKASTIEESNALLLQAFQLIDDSSLKYYILMKIFAHSLSILPTLNSKSDINIVINNNNNSSKAIALQEKKDFFSKVITEALPEVEKIDLLNCLQFLPTSALGDGKAKNENRVFFDVFDEIRTAQSLSTCPSYL